MNYQSIKDQAQEYTVSKITEAIRELMYKNFSSIKIKGEVSNLKISTKGHAYFALKDNENTINVVCFSYYLKKLKINIADGVEIIAYGQIDIFGSGYQLKMESGEYSGIGIFMKLIEERKQKLAKLGIFDQLNKKKIPSSYEINNVGIITSPTGAVIQDIINRVVARYPHNISLFGTLVQGTEAPEQIVAGIRYFNNEAKIKPDVIIIARGGGSMEDLFCFNDEAIAMAVFESKIPIISAIGHETDTTIIDFVSDLRVPTPTAAAEIITTPTIFDIYNSITNNRKIIINHMSKKVSILQEKLVFLKTRILLTKNSLGTLDRTFLLLKERLKSSIMKNISLCNNTNIRLMQKFLFIRDIIYKKFSFYTTKLKEENNRVSFFSDKIMNKLSKFNKDVGIAIWRLFDKNYALNQAISLKFFNEHKNRLSKFSNFVDKSNNSLSYLDFTKNLKKGYAIVLDNNEKITKNTEQLNKSDLITVKLYDGVVKIKK